MTEAGNNAVTEADFAAELIALRTTVARMARARGASSAVADDIAQETVARMLAARKALTSDARLPYGIATAGNLLADLRRHDERQRRHRHRFLDVPDASHPEELLVAQEQAIAVREALNRLSHDDRQLLLDHEGGASTAQLADAAESTPGAIAARLHRTRARMRLDYVLALRRVELPTAGCRRVLLAISAGDQRRQRALGVDRHLEGCATCTALSPPLFERSSRLAGIAAAPLVVLGGLGGRIGRMLSTSTGQAAGAVTAAAVAAAGYGLASQSHTARSVPAPAPPALLRTSDGRVLLPVPAPAALRGLVRRNVIADGVPVQAVVTHPGFWVGTSATQRLYVHIVDPQRVTRQVRAGMRLRFTGQLVRNAPGFAATDGLTTVGGAALLTAEGVHINVTAAVLPRG